MNVSGIEIAGGLPSFANRAHAGGMAQATQQPDFLSELDRALAAAEPTRNRQQAAGHDPRAESPRQPPKGEAGEATCRETEEPEPAEGSQRPAESDSTSDETEEASGEGRRECEESARPAETESMDRGHEGGPGSDPGERPGATAQAGEAAGESLGGIPPAKGEPGAGARSEGPDGDASAGQPASEASEPAEAATPLSVRHPAPARGGDSDQHASSKEPEGVPTGKEGAEEASPREPAEKQAADRGSASRTDNVEVRRSARAGRSPQAEAGEGGDSRLKTTDFRAAAGSASRAATASESDEVVRKQPSSQASEAQKGPELQTTGVSDRFAGQGDAGARSEPDGGGPSSGDRSPGGQRTINETRPEGGRNHSDADRSFRAAPKTAGPDTEPGPGEAPDAQRSVRLRPGASRSPSDVELNADFTHVARRYEQEVGHVHERPIQHVARRVANEVRSEVIRRVQYVQRNGRSEMRLQLQPPELGRIRLEVEMREGRVEVRMRVENPDVRAAMDRQLHSLDRALRQAEVDVSRFELTDYQSGRWCGGGETDGHEFGNTYPRAGGAPDEDPSVGEGWARIGESGSVDCMI